MRFQFHASAILGCAALLLTGCAAKPREKPLPTTRVAEGPETTAGARKQLEGRWVLESLDVTAADGRHGTIDANGTLTLDAYGGLQIEYRMTEGGQRTLKEMGISTPNPVISTSGPVVIDPQRKQITYIGNDFEKQALGFDPDLAARRANPFALERVRYYAVGENGTLLTLSTRYDNGHDAAVSRWRKAASGPSRQERAQ
jgi:hypothetical protein